MTSQNNKNSLLYFASMCKWIIAIITSCLITFCVVVYSFVDVCAADPNAAESIESKNISSTVVSKSTVGNNPSLNRLAGSDAFSTMKEIVNKG